MIGPIIKDCLDESLEEYAKRKDQLGTYSVLFLGRKHLEPQLVCMKIAYSIDLEIQLPTVLFILWLSCTIASMVTF
jgi:hypothetical protein